MTNTLFIITAEWCVHCKTFKERGHLKTIENEVAKIPNLKLIEITITKDNKKEIEQRYGKVMTYVKAFPCFLLFNSSYANNSNKLELVATPFLVNDKFEIKKDANNKPVQDPNFRTTSDFVLSWVNSNLQNNPIFKVSSINHGQGLATKPETAGSLNKAKPLPNVSGDSKGNYKLVLVNKGKVVSRHDIPGSKGDQLIGKYMNQ